MNLFIIAMIGIIGTIISVTRRAFIFFIQLRSTISYIHFK
ncbi:hypothetical protein SAMN04487996_111205 [Dyadobacter soli]|uniref:Uncharacterized protein n=1 Tax=Dyadobacter soli TaxID=659014 RepID=A0A1G7MAD7_9BACT|nr:hypothetical protein SAMN04487996_111205 [Dyadobacter soli]